MTSNCLMENHDPNHLKRLSKTQPQWNELHHTNHLAHAMTDYKCATGRGPNPYEVTFAPQKVAPNYSPCTIWAGCRGANS
jgi:hypothetical protein